MASKSVGNLYVSLGLNTTPFTKGMHDAQDKLRQFERASKGGSQAFGMLSGKIDLTSAALGRMRGLLTAGALIGGAKALIDISDRYTELDGRLRLVTKSASEFQAAQVGLYAIAQGTRVQYEATVDLYTRLARSTSELGLSQKDLLGITESINKALIVSGASGESAKAALMQLGQGMASGALRGEELNSVMEQTPRLAQMIADGLGVGIGQLRDMGKEGKLTSEVLIGALQRGAEKVNAEFVKMPETVGQAMTKLNNVIDSIINQSNNAAGASQSLAGAIDEIGTTLDKNRDGIINSFIAIANSVNWTAERVAALGNAVALFNKMRAGKVSFGDWLTADAEDAKRLLGQRRTAEQMYGLVKNPRVGNDFSSLSTKPSVSPKTATAKKSGTKVRDEFADMIASLEDERRQLTMNEAEYKVYQAIKKAGVAVDSDQADRIETIITANERLRASMSQSEEYDRVVASLEDERRQISMNAVEYKTYNAIKQAGVDVDSEQADKIRTIISENEALREEHDKVADSQDNLAKKSVTATQMIEQGIVDWASMLDYELNDMLWNADRTFGDILKSFTQMLTQMVIRATIVQPIVNGLSDMFGLDTKNARGNIYGNAGLVPFANGGVVTRPTIFPFANGTGLMGEAGPEAIMPLRRGANGKLGVAASGSSGVNVQVQVINNSGQKISDRTETKFNGRDYVITTVLEAVGSNTNGARDGLKAMLTS